MTEHECKNRDFNFAVKFKAQTYNKQGAGSAR